ncbi:uncharacterized protein LOC134335490 [Trichomycterus rosablanca]|uniref:uncharacterized protein LOC134335490 n=1 Tax=Trichomycterus rosablanca TaxID=2290929 RepID=UPI002F352D22
MSNKTSPGMDTKQTLSPSSTKILAHKSDSLLCIKNYSRLDESSTNNINSGMLHFYSDVSCTPPEIWKSVRSNQGMHGANKESSAQSSLFSESTSTTIKEADLLEDPVVDVQSDVLVESTASSIVEETQAKPGKTPTTRKLCSAARRFYRGVQKRVCGFVSGLRRSDSPRKETSKPSHGHCSQSDSILDTAWVRNVEQEDSLPALSPLLMIFVEKAIRRLLIDVLGPHPLGQSDLLTVAEFGSSSAVPAHTRKSTGIHDKFTYAVGGLTQMLGRLVMESFKTSSGKVNLPVASRVKPVIKQVNQTVISHVRTTSTKSGKSPTPACSALVSEPMGEIDCGLENRSHFSPIQVSDNCSPDEVPATKEKRGSGLPVTNASEAHMFILILKKSNKVHPVGLESVSHQRSSVGDLQEASCGTPEVSASSAKKLRGRLRGMFSAFSKNFPNPFKHCPTPAE